MLQSTQRPGSVERWYRSFCSCVVFSRLSLATIYFLSLFAAFSLVGCGTAAKEGLYAFQGGTGRVVMIDGDSRQTGSLAYRYGSVRIESFTSDIGRVCPSELISALPSVIREHLTYRPRSFGEKVQFKDDHELGPFFTGPADKVLVIRGRVIHYDVGSGLVQKAVSSLEEVVCRVGLYDSSSGELIAEANCSGRNKSAFRTGSDELCQGVAKAIVKFLAPSSPGGGQGE